MLDLSSYFLLFVLGVIGWFTYKAYIWPYYISPLRKIPGPPSDNPFFGSFKRLFADEEAPEPHLGWIKKYGNVTKFHGILNRPIVLVTDTKIVQEIVSNHVYNFPKPTHLLADLLAIIGRGLVLVEGDTHKRQRKMMNPAFSHNCIKEMVPTFVRVALTLKDLIEDKVDKGESKINLYPYISKATLDIIGLVGFNYEFNTLTSRSELADAYESIFNPKLNATYITLSVLSNYIPFIRKIPLATNKRFNHCVEVVDRVSKQLVQERYNETELNSNDLLSSLVKINKDLPTNERMTYDELKYQIMTFLTAGHGTSSVAISWILYLLSLHQNEQDLLRKELVDAFRDKSKFNPTFDEINSLEYLNCVIKETFRMIPPVGAIGRVTTEDKVLGEYFIPKNTQIDISISALHRLPSIWGPTADDFDPKRWLNPSLVENVTNFNYLPFMTGPRSCIGNKLAISEIKVLLSMLIRNFVFQPVEGLHIKKTGVLFCRPHPSLELIVTKVEA